MDFTTAIKWVCTSIDPARTLTLLCAQSFVCLLDQINQVWTVKNCSSVLLCKLQFFPWWLKYASTMLFNFTYIFPSNITFTFCFCLIKWITFEWDIYFEKSLKSLRLRLLIADFGRGGISGISANPTLFPRCLRPKLGVIETLKILEFNKHPSKYIFQKSHLRMNGYLF